MFAMLINCKTHKYNSDMRKIRLYGIVFILALTFTACSTSESLDQLIEDTEIENVESTEDENSTDPVGG